MPVIPEVRITSLRSFLVAVVVAAVLVLASFANAPKLPASFPDAQQTLAYLNQTIDWYRQLAVEQQIAADLLRRVDQLLRQLHRLRPDSLIVRLPTKHEANVV
jgi:hypothetical protein